MNTLTSQFIVRVIIYLVCFGVTLFSMGAINYEKLLKKNRVIQAQILYVLVSMAIAYLVAQFIFGLVLKLNI